MSNMRGAWFCPVSVVSWDQERNQESLGSTGVHRVQPERAAALPRLL